MSENAVGQVCVVGSINLDIVTRVHRLPRPGETLLGAPIGRFPGGKGFNQAVAARRCGATVRFCGAVGDDADGSYLRRMASESGVAGTDLAVVASAPTGVAHIFALPGADNSIVVVPGANAALSADAAATAVTDADVLLVQLEIPIAVADAALTAARSAEVVTILNAAPATQDAIELLDRVDVLVVNEDESQTLGGPARCLRLGAGSVVVTLGALGCELHREGVETVRFAAFDATAVDTTGAGDAFCGALAAALANGAELSFSIPRAAAAGSIAVGAVGAQTDRLTVHAIDQLIAANSR